MSHLQFCFASISDTLTQNKIDRAKTTIFSEGRSVQCDLTFFPPSSAAWRELPVEVRVEEVEEQTASIRLSLQAASECM